MSWELLPVNYTDAVWSGLKKYVQVDNEDGTVSFQDVTQYSQKEHSFFGAYDANRMNEALNTLMNMVESGTDLYEAFQNYFAAQKVLFENNADSEYAGFVTYVENLESQGDAIIAALESDYSDEIEAFEGTQEQVFNTWFDMMKDQLSRDAAGHLQNQCTELDERLSNLEYMTIQNDFSAPLATDDQTLTLITDDYDYVLLAEWKHETE